MIENRTNGNPKGFIMELVERFFQKCYACGVDSNLIACIDLIIIYLVIVAVLCIILDAFY